jgi:fructose transport system ATP-binding protein
MTMSEDYILETRGLTKHYGGVHALQDANFKLRKGEHIAIMGDNGAGKSTFVRQITGVETRTAGDVIFDGEPVNFAGPLDAREAGIETVFQTLALADDLDVPDNLFLGREKTRFDFLGPFRLLDYKAMREQTMEGLQRTGVKIPNIRNAIRNMWRPMPMCCDCADSNLRVQTDDHGRADCGLGCSGNRAGGKHHPYAEGSRRAAYLGQPQHAPGL